MIEVVGIEESDPVVQFLIGKTKESWKITRITFEEKKVVSTSEPRKWIHLTCVGPDGNSYDYSYNYSKIKRGIKNDN